MFVESKIERLF